MYKLILKSLQVILHRGNFSFSNLYRDYFDDDRTTRNRKKETSAGHTYIVVIIINERFTLATTS
jgi:hypothetical protein